MQRLRLIYQVASVNGTLYWCQLMAQVLELRVQKHTPNDKANSQAHVNTNSHLCDACHRDFSFVSPTLLAHGALTNTATKTEHRG